MASSDQYDPHYLRDVTAYGDTHEVRTSRAIFTRNRIKLVDKGVRLDSGLYERLMRHTLAPPIEECITVADAVSGADLKAQGTALLDSDSGYALLKAPAARPFELLLALETVPIDEPLAVRLTVMRDRRPQMLGHSIGAALLNAYLGRRTGRVSGELAQWAGAGLYHDLGEMHVDPALFGSGRPLTGRERQHLRTHPLTAYLVLQPRAVCGAALADAVFEHHERLDGSGYPRGIRGDELSEAGRALAIAEVAASFFAAPRAPAALQRLRVVLQLNHRRFDRAFAGHIIALARQEQPADEAGGGPPQPALQRLRAIQGVFRDWHKLAPAGYVPADDELPAFQWAAERLGQMERSLLEAGLDVSLEADLAESLEADPGSAVELPALVQEVTWLLAEIVQGVDARLGESRGGPIAGWAERTGAAFVQEHAAA